MGLIAAASGAQTDEVSRLLQYHGQGVAALGIRGGFEELIPDTSAELGIGDGTVMHQALQVQRGRDAQRDLARAACAAYGEPVAEGVLAIEARLGV